MKKFLWHDEFLQHARFADFEKRKQHEFHAVEYFLARFPQHLLVEQADQVYDKFRLYQSLPDVPPELTEVFQTFREGEEHGHVPADVLWHELGNSKMLMESSSLDC